MLPRLVAYIGLLILVSLEMVCHASAADAWTNAIKPCADNQTWTPKNMVYMGPSNNVGVGAVWRKRTEGGYALIEFAPRDAKSPVGEPIYAVGHNGSCAGKASHSVQLRTSADLVLTVIPGESTELAADLKRAKIQEFRIDFWREMLLAEGPFDRWVESLASDSEYKRSLLRQDDSVAYRAVEVTGMTATLTFDGNTVSDIHGKYSGIAATSDIAEFGVRLAMEKTDSNTLLISSPQAFFSEAGRAKYIPGVGVGRGRLVSEPANSGTTLSFEAK